MTDLPWPSDGPSDGSPAAAADAAVRHAGAGDVAAMTRVQARAWRQAYAGVVPADALAGLDGDGAQRAWAAAVASQAPRRHVLVATAGAEVVGLAAVAAATDPDLDPEVDAELAVLVVDPAHARRGHGSRLLAAVADLLREDRFTHVFTWVPSTDDALRRLLVESGWAADGARRSLGSGGEEGAAGPDGPDEAHQLRLVTAL